ncbi:zinc-ribbon domain-containing protein [Bifidobacterium longum]|nr:zinc ribbon domain-containing protein [Bifidobacterium longum]UNL66247.1 zinc-ribbon domain-containing protein [Bifidobacterium longum subsp. longum]UNL68238.1 zinc-ribbon domain-containing protein [Bifidobacterium longum subsp. longum]UNL70090.1 zinc-ribbon domain-containing protein [Bifidobacterium longum subsp. longum]UNL71461.1 zinc-ribbon domain-containing protein [Bifidobacterium longum subsp. longum]UNL82497.1 zinc-ribbon domain-containing protein [Bifidobacterium longum subsp. longu
MFCPNCGAAVREGAQFCGSCGNHLAAASAPAAATPAAPTPGQPTGAVPTTAQPAAPAPSIPLPGAAAVQPTPQPAAQP